MPCQVNSILKLKRSQDYPERLELATQHNATKDGYRIFPVDIPIPLVDERWVAHADAVITKLTWENGQTHLTFRVDRIYTTAFPVKG